jgi:antitoxin component YwqK of YwqJK toxin-antitoxin module
MSDNQTDEQETKKPKSKIITEEQLASLKPPKLELDIDKEFDEASKEDDADETGVKHLDYEDHKIEYNVVKGIKNGPFKFFDEKGVLSMEFTYKNDVLDGQGKFFYESGVLERVVNFSKGKLEGLSQSFYQTGELWMEIPFVANKINGKLVSYNKKGGIDSIAFYKDNQLHGKQTIYIKNKEYITKYYKNGEEVENEKEFKQNS